MDKSQIYSVLIYALRDRVSNSILPNSIFIHKDSSAFALAIYIKRFLLIAENKYDFYDEYDLVISGREWLTKEDIKKRIQNKNIKNIELESNKLFSDVSNIISEDIKKNIDILKNKYKWDKN